MMSSRSIVCASLVLFSACTKSEGPLTYGDPVGIEVGGDKNLPPILAAVAVDKDRSIGNAVPDLAGALYAAAQKCPDVLATIGQGQMTVLHLTITNGVVKAVPYNTDDTGGTCMMKNMEGRSIKLGSTELTHVLVEIISKDAGGMHAN